MSTPNTTPAAETPSTAADLYLKQTLHVMGKPTGAICNLDCEYCYYLHKEDLYPSGSKFRMGPDTLTAYIRQLIDAQPASEQEIHFAWQGGEPTLLGVEFFRRVVELQQSLCPPGRRISNSLQTNGVLLDDAWCEFFKEHDFLIGLSIDGPAELHDRYRLDKHGRPTFRRVLDAWQRLKAAEVEINLLVVVNRENGDYGRRVYTYLRDNGARFLQFIPIVERLGVGRHGEGGDTSEPEDEYASLVSSRSVRPRQYGQFLVDVFDEWKTRDVGTVFVQIFDQALSAWVGVEPSLCVFRKRCGRALALEHNGDLYSCDHFVDDTHRLGNIHDLPILELANSPQQVAFGDAKANLPQYCRDCEVEFICHGECPKNRFLSTPSGEPNLNYLCEGLRLFFNHIDPTMRAMADAIRAGRPPASVMRPAKPAPSRSPAPGGRPVTAGRNDPCPCGSGRKYKKCCGR